jgi:hypothetical protein
MWLPEASSTEYKLRESVRVLTLRNLKCNFKSIRHNHNPGVQQSDPGFLLIHHVPAAAIAGMTAVPMHRTFVARAAHFPARRFTFLRHHWAFRPLNAFRHHRAFSVLATALIAALAGVTAGVVVIAAGTGLRGLRGIRRRLLWAGLREGA